MSEASVTSHHDSWASAEAASAAAAAAAAAERTRSTSRRLIELQQRMDRLRAGQLSTRDDVARARAAVEAQRRACANAQRRMALARRAPRQRTGAPISPTVVDTYAWLRDGFISLASSRLAGDDTRSDQARCRELAVALVERASDPRAGWTQALCQLAVAVIPAAIGAAVSTYDELGVAYPFAAADDRSLELEELQQVVGEGPGHAARLSGQPVLVDLSQQDDRWPWYLSATRGRGVGRVWSLPVSLDDTVLGSLTLYQDAGQALAESDRRDAVTLAGLAVTTMIIDADLQDHVQPDERPAADAVALASGVLAVRTGTSVDQALALLRGYAFSTGRRISDVAADVLTGAVDLE